MRAPTRFLLLGLALAAPALPPSARAQDVTEPRSGVRFPARADGMSLLGASVRTRTMLKVKVYALALYAGDTVLRGPLAAFKGKTTSPEFYDQLIWGDFPRQIKMKFVRDVTHQQIRDAFRETLTKVDRSRLDAFLGYFPDTRSGQEYVLRWVPGRGLVTTVAGQEKPAIADKDFAAAVFAVWLGARPIQDDIKRDLVSRAPQVMP
ncbi:MAG TPA: chalcone isomerase family protein [Vicinamibacteria bacterium]|nr:chalcone isomerase family protein [Vicinamibacteria bacterium]